MNADQLQQLLGVIRVGGGGGHNTAKFSSAEGTEWRIWRRNFEQTIQINGWANERSQREAAAVMELTAAEFTSDIPAHVAGVGHRGHAQPVRKLLSTCCSRTTSRCTIPDGCSNGGGANRRLACMFEDHIRTRFSRKKHPRFEVAHQ
jgi:hypothetical protein